MLEGHSWSGHERNNCYLNLDDGRFADVSAMSGLDYADDGRAVAAVDWDADGDLDLWLRNRSGPQLRFMRNDLERAGHWIGLELVGTTSNRDAVGARVELFHGATRAVGSVVAGDGYLAQSSRRLHFGLGGADRVDRLIVHWPGAPAEEFPGPAVDRVYRIVQGSGEARPLPLREVRLSRAPADAAAPPPSPMPLLLKEPLILPPGLGKTVFGSGLDGRPKLISLWAHWCAPCIEELTALAEAYADLQAAGLDVVAVNVDSPEDREQAIRLFETQVAPRMEQSRFVPRMADERTTDLFDAVLQHVIGRARVMALPTSLLVDAQGSLQLIYVGPLTVDRLLEDAKRWAGKPVPAAERSLHPGRWYFRTPRDLMGLAHELKRRGLREDARFYLSVGQLRRIEDRPPD
jgi:thiol-disulfide isomerase/thioredoxin